MEPHVSDEGVKIVLILSSFRIFRPRWLGQQSAPRSKRKKRLPPIVTVILFIGSTTLYASLAKAGPLILHRGQEQRSLIVLQSAILNMAGTSVENVPAVRFVMTGLPAAQSLFLIGAVFGSAPVIQGMLLKEPYRFLGLVLVLGALEFIIIVYFVVERNRTVRSLRALRQIEKSYRRLVELAPDAMLVHRSGEIIFANKACAALLGAGSANELLGKQTVDFVPPGERTAFRQGIRSYLINASGG